MQPITDDLIESLLNEDEGTALDFKRDQYPFAGASKNDKSELLKDILALANSWRRSDAYLLIGVDERTGARSVIVGVTKHLDDAQLQQFVNSKTQRPVEFRYVGYGFEGKQIGVIQIPGQERPVFLTKPYGKLDKERVYVRRGSSTAPADLDEVLKMKGIQETKAPSLEFLTEVVRVRSSGSRHVVDAHFGVRNTGTGSAVAIQVTVRLPSGCSWQQYGLDGNGNDGLPWVPADGGGQARVYGGPDAVLHPDDTRMITAFVVRSGPDGTVPGGVTLDFELSAQDTRVQKGVAILEESVLNAALESARRAAPLA